MNQEHNATGTLSREIQNRIAYFNWIVIGFAKGFKMTIPDAFRYLKRFGGLDFLYSNYDYEHTQSEHYTMMALWEVCYRNGGYR